MFDVSEAQIRDFQGAQRRVDGNFGDVARLDSVSVGDSRLPTRPGQQVRLGLTWSVTASGSDPYSAFVHVVDSAGRVVAQDDRQGLPTNGWQPGQRFLSLHELRLPPDVAPGGYRVMAGLEHRSVDVQPSRSLGELGAQVNVRDMDVS